MTQKLSLNYLKNKSLYSNMSFRRIPQTGQTTTQRQQGPSARAARSSKKQNRRVKTNPPSCEMLTKSRWECSSTVAPSCRYKYAGRPNLISRNEKQATTEKYRKFVAEKSPEMK